MKKFLSLPLVLAFAPSVSFAQMNEARVSIESSGQEVVGTLVLPDGGPSPVVLLLHGFVGSRDEMMIPSVNEGIFTRTARVLASHGYASLRIDFRGSRESIVDADFAEMTFERQIADALASTRYLQTLSSVNGEEIHLIGWSQGGLVAAAAAGRINAFDGVALWQAVTDPQRTYETLLGEDVMETGFAANDDELISATLPWGTENCSARYFLPRAHRV